MRFDLDTIVQALTDSVTLVTTSDAIRAGILETTVDTLLNIQEDRERRFLAQRQASRKRDVQALLQANIRSIPIEQSVPIDDITLDPNYNVRTNERYRQSDSHLKETILSNGLSRRIESRNSDDFARQWNPSDD